MPNKLDSDSPVFLRLNAANLFVPGDNDQRTLAIEVLAKAGFHPVRHNLEAVRIERIDGHDVTLEGEFVAIAALGRGEEVEKKAQGCIEALGIVNANSQLLWATAHLEIIDIRGS